MNQKEVIQNNSFGTGLYDSKKPTTDINNRRHLQGPNLKLTDIKQDLSMKNNVSRRNFIKLAGVYVIGATATLSFNGCKKRSKTTQLEEMHTITLIIDDFKYYRAVESVVRKEMKKFEAKVILPLARTAIKDGGLESKVNKNQPVEGYYNETPELKETFFLMRALQRNFTPMITKAISSLHDIYDPRKNSIFGLKQAFPTAINPNDVLYPNKGKVTISPAADPVSLASAEVVRQTGGPNWTIDNIMDNIKTKYLGTSLVGFAYLVDRKNKREHWNPLATCLACETTVLSRNKVIYLSLEREYTPPKIQIVWNVTQVVEKYGENMIKGYNKLFKTQKFKENIPYVNKDNIKSILDSAEDLIRVVCLNIDNTQMTNPRYYHWGIVGHGDKYVVEDFFDSRINTTQEWKESHIFLSPTNIINR